MHVYVLNFTPPFCQHNVARLNYLWCHGLFKILCNGDFFIYFMYQYLPKSVLHCLKRVNNYTNITSIAPNILETELKGLINQSIQKYCCYKK